MNSRTIEKMLSFLSDEQYIRLKYFYKTGKLLNLRNPVTFNEKIQWLKLNDRQAEYSKYVDKVAVKCHVSDTVGSQYVIPTIGIWESVDAIDFSTLPESFVIKTNHDSGGSYICKYKDELDIAHLKKQISKQLSDDYYIYGREWPYKSVKHKILAEELLKGSGGNVKDYKFFCFNGTPKIVQVDIDRFSNHRRNIYDVEWNYLGIEFEHSTAPEIKVSKPDHFEEMLRIARVLSKNLLFVRVDLYEENDKVYFGEMTLYPESGFGKFNPEEWDKKLGDWLVLPK